MEHQNPETLGGQNPEDKEGMEGSVSYDFFGLSDSFSVGDVNLESAVVVDKREMVVENDGGLEVIDVNRFDDVGAVNLTASFSELVDDVDVSGVVVDNGFLVNDVTDKAVENENGPTEEAAQNENDVADKANECGVSGEAAENKNGSSGETAENKNGATEEAAENENGVSYKGVENENGANEEAAQNERCVADKAGATDEAAENENGATEEATMNENDATEGAQNKNCVADQAVENENGATDETAAENENGITFETVENNNGDTVVGSNENVVNLGCAMNGFEEEKAEGELEEKDESMGHDGVVSDRKFEICGGNISLYVDFSSSLDGNNTCNLDDVDYSGMLIGQEDVSEEIDNEKMKELLRKFSVGDIVWVKTNNQSWWPGKVYDPLDARKYDLDSDQTNCLLTGYFGINHVFWCSPSRLKPFHEDFELMVGGNKVRSFFFAVEKAADEFGKCLKSHMMCSCIPKKSQQSSGEVEGEGSLLERFSDFGKFSFTQFELDKFLSQIKNHALAVSKLGILDATAAKNYLSAFYHSIGHSQVPMEQLVESRDDQETSETSNGEMQTSEVDGLQQNMNEEPTMVVRGGMDTTAKNSKSDLPAESIIQNNLSSSSRKRKKKMYSEVEGYDSLSGYPPKETMTEEFRERKKSWYLSYPFVNFGPKSLPSGTEESKAENIYLEKEHEKGVADQFNGSQSVSKSSGKRFQRNWFKKYIRNNDVSTKPELINASTNNFLSELRLTAINCLYSKETENFDLMEWFFARFRILSFHDESIYEMQCKNMIGVSNEALLEDTQATKQTSLDPDGDKKMRKKRKNGASSRSNNKSVNGLSDVNINIAVDGTSVNELCEMDLPTPNGRPGPKKGKKQGTAPTDLPDLNSNGTISGLSVENSAIVGNVEHDSTEMERKASDVVPDPLLVDFQVGGTVTINTIPKEITGEEIAAGVQTSNENSDIPNMLEKEVPAASLSPVEDKPGPSKRKRKSFSEQVTVAGGEPGLDGTPAEPGLDGTSAEPGMQAKPQRKPRKKETKPRRRRKPRVPVMEGEQVKPGVPVISMNQDNTEDEQVTPRVPVISTNQDNMEDEQVKPRVPVISTNQDNMEGEQVTVAGGGPGLNGIPAKPGILAKPQRKPRKKETKPRRPRKPRAPAIYMNQCNMGGSSEALGSALILTFASGVTLPSKEVLVATFCRFGTLKESELRLNNDTGTAHVIFMKGTDAAEAAKSLEVCSPFGATLVNYRLHLPSAAGTPQVIEKSPAKSYSLMVNPADAPPIDLIRKNLEMMTSMLEQAGDSLSPEMRSKLESEIKGLLKKVSAMPSSSS